MTGRIDIRTTRPMLDISSTPIRLDMRQTMPGFNLSREKGGIDIQVERPQLVVDSSECFAEEGDKTISRLISDAADEAMQAVQEGCSQRAAEGWNIMKNFHSSKNVIAEMAKSKITPGMGQTVLTFIPSQPPKISFTDNVFDMTVTPDKIDIEWNISNTADIAVAQKPSVDIRMVQYPSIQFTYIPPQFDTTA